MGAAGVAAAEDEADLDFFALGPPAPEADLLGGMVQSMQALEQNRMQTVQIEKDKQEMQITVRTMNNHERSSACFTIAEVEIM